MPKPSSDAPIAPLLTLTEARFNALTHDPECFILHDPELQVQLMRDAGSMQQPAGVRFGDEILFGPLRIENHPAPALRLAADRPNEPSKERIAFGSFQVFESSYCLRSTVLEANEGGLLLAWPDRLYLRRRRHSLRLSLALPLDGICLAGEQEHEASITDISDRGVGLLLPLADSLTGALDLQIELPDGPLSVKASVRWTHRTPAGLRAGAEFATLDRGLRGRLRQRRRLQRVELTPPAACRLLRTGGGELQAEIHDISELGARIHLPDQRPLSPGDHIPEILTSLEDAPVLSKVDVRWARDLGAGQLIGVRFAGIGGQTRDRLLGFLLPRLRPHIRCLKPDQIREAVELYTDVNHPGMLLEAAGGNFQSTWERLTEQGRHLGQLMGLQRDDHLAGVTAINHLWPGTWVAHSTAALQDTAKLPCEVLRVGAVERMETQDSADHLVILQSASSPPPIDPSVRPEYHARLRLRLWRTSTLSSHDGPVRRASEEDHTEFSATLWSQWPELVLRAMDMEEGAGDLGALARDYMALGLQRRRELLVLDGDLGPIAWAVLERLPPGLSLDPGLEGAWLFTSDEEQSPDNLKPLIDACRARFSDQSDCLLISTDIALSLPDASPLPGMDLWFIAAEAAEVSHASILK